MVEDEGARFENLVASHLLKLCHFLEDTEGLRLELRFLRDTDGREVDFVVLRERKPWFAVECKTGDRTVSPAVRYFKERTAIPRWYQRVVDVLEIALHLSHSTIDNELDARDETCIIRSQEQDRRGDFLWSCHPAKGDIFASPKLQVGS